MESQENTEIAKRKIRFWAIGTVITALTLGLLVAPPFLALNGKYGAVLFIGIPFSIGMFFSFAQSSEKRTTLTKIFLVFPFVIVSPLLSGIFLFEKMYDYKPSLPYFVISFLICIFFIFIFAQSSQKRTALWQSFLVFLLSIVSSLVGVLVVGKEGFICILMALPIFYVPLLIGVVIGYLIQNRILSKYLLLLIVFTFNIRVCLRSIRL